MTENHEFNRIYEEYKNPILKIAYLYVKDFEIAEDIMHDTFLKLFVVMGRTKEIENIESWLFVTAKHQAINYCKKIVKWEVRLEGDISSDDSTDPLGYEPLTESAEEEYLEELTNKQKTEFHNRVMAALMEKNKRWHNALLLDVHLKIPQKKAAESMGISLNAYQVMLHRAREWIREKYGVEYEELKQK